MKQRWFDASDLSIDLITSMLDMNSNKRCSASQALKHDWFKERGQHEEIPEVQDMFANRILLFRAFNRLKQAAFRTIALLISEVDAAVAREIVLAFDCDLKGSVEWKHFDPHENYGQHSAVSYTELLASTFERKRFLGEKVVKVAFASFTRRGDDRIYFEDIRNGTLLGQLTDEELEKIFIDIGKCNEADAETAGFVEFPAFLSMLRAGVDRKSLMVLPSVSNPQEASH